jgi:hypothetical protein
MSVFSIRPLGLRENLLAFELQGDAIWKEAKPADIREAFVLWNPQGRPHAAYPELTITRAMTGREVLEWQREAWAVHVTMTRQRFGAAPLSGVPRQDQPLRGILAFPVELFSGKGRWTLVHKGGWRWYFSPEQLRDGTRLPVPPANNG